MKKERHQLTDTKTNLGNMMTRPKLDEKREPEGRRVDLICNYAMKQFEL